MVDTHQIEPEQSGNKKPAVIGLDIGGTKIVAGLISYEGEILASDTLPTPKTGAMDIFNTAVTVCQQVMAQSDTPPLAIGAGSAGQVDSASGRITYATNLAGWTGFPLGEQLQSAFNLPVIADNDVNAMAYGESLRGAGIGAESVLYVAIGTGIGGALVFNGELWRGAHHSAGEIGYLVAGWQADGTPEFLETLTAGPALERIYAEKTGQRRSLRDISAQAINGDAVSVEVIRNGAALLGYVLNPALLVIDPHMLIIGGGVPEIGALWWDAFEVALRTGHFPAPKQVEIRKAKFTFNAVMIGAGMLGWSLVSLKK